MLEDHSSDSSEEKTKAAQLIQKLSPEKQALLAQKLRQKREQADRHSTTKTSTAPAADLPLMPIVMLNYAYHDPQPWWRAFEEWIEIPRMVTPAHLNAVVQALTARHDNLRLRLVKEERDFRLFIDSVEPQAFLEKDLSGLSAIEQDAALDASVEEQWAALNFSTGPSFRVVFFNLGAARLPRVLILLHHFAADGFSVGLLMNDFRLACQQILTTGTIHLPAATTSIKQWAENMYGYVHSMAAEPEKNYWKSLPWASLEPTPVDHPEVTNSPSARLIGALNPAETQILLNRVPSVYNVQLLDILLAACAITYARYTRLKLFSVSIIHHGRNLSLDGMDLTRTVGNFYTPYPLFFDVDPDWDVANPEKALQIVASKRAAVPSGGAAWPWISYYANERYISWQDNMKIAHNAVFNYLGQVNLDTQDQPGMFRQIDKPAPIATSKSFGVKGVTPHTCTTIVENDCLKLSWEYYSAADDEDTIERLIQDYLAVLRIMIARAM